MVGTNPTGSMLHLFLGLKSLVKVSRFHTDCSVFRLHYRVTVMVLLAFTFIVTSRQYIGAAIMCVHTEEIPKEVLNTYCWIHPTYTLRQISQQAQLNFLLCKSLVIKNIFFSRNFFLTLP